MDFQSRPLINKDLSIRNPIKWLFAIISAAPGFHVGLSLWMALTLACDGAEVHVLSQNGANAATGLRPTGSLPDLARLNLAISLPLRNQPALARLLQQIYDPGSPHFHRYLTPAEFTEQFGPSGRDYQTLIDFAAAHHLKVTHTHPNRTLLDISASVADIRRVMGVHINLYQHPTQRRTFYAPDGNPTVDAGIALLAIKGLDNFNLPQPDSKPMPAAPSGPPEPLAGSGPGGEYLGLDFRAAYAPGVSLDGTEQTVALVEFDGYYPGDITAYEQTPMPHLPAVPLTNVLVNGYNGAAGPNNEEVALDIEMLISMSPGLSRIMVYEAQLFQSEDDILNRIATDNAASQISCSWNIVNDATGDQIFQEYAAQGQSFFQSSGDTGAYAAGQVNSLADDPFITIVGGTQLATSGAAGAWNSEIVWSGSSGGFSTNYAIPYWQTGVNVLFNGGSPAFRNLPDVAMCAYNVFVTYGNGARGGTKGTSCAAPLWAGFTALINQQAAQFGNPPVGFLNPALYAIGTGVGYAANFHDITNGNNTNAASPDAYFAMPGYDLCTGWGTPEGSNLINALAPPDTLVMLPVPGFNSSGPAGGPFDETMESFLLTNEGSASLNWSLQSDAPWLSAWPASGTLNPGAMASVEVNLNAAATNLLVGDYTAHVTLTNQSNGLLHDRTFALQILDPLTVSPTAGLEFAGPPSGPFNVGLATCVLTNASQATVSWSVVTNPLWLNVSPASGVLEPSGTAWVSCSLNTAATNLPSGALYASVVFTNNTYGAQETLPLLFLVGQLVQNGGFETGDLTGWAWTDTNDASESFVSTNSIAVYSGVYGLELGEAGGLAYLTQAIPTVPGTWYSLSLWLDSPDGLQTNEFSVSWGGATLFDYKNLPAIGWTNLQFTVLATNTNTVLALGARDDPSYLGLDDVSVTAAPPILSGVNPASGPSAGGTTVTISGIGFQSHATVVFGSLAAASVTFNSTSNLMVLTPAFSTAGPVNVGVINADGQMALLTNGFLFLGSPLITWTNPPALTYGSALGAAQLNASANVPGAFSYIPPAGTVLDAGSNLLSAVFTPYDSVDYSSVTGYVELVIAPASLTVTASNATRLYGLSNPAFTGLIAGVQNGDNITATYSCAATPASPAGSYQIVPSLVDPDDRLPNYQVFIFDGTLTVLTPVPPALQAAALSGGLFSLSWTATAGAAYQVQYNPLLTDSNWSNLGGHIVATEATASVIDAITNVQRFYRVLQVPQ
jgi:hypothetical protein